MHTILMEGPRRHPNLQCQKHEYLNYTGKIKMKLVKKAGVVKYSAPVFAAFAALVAFVILEVQTTQESSALLDKSVPLSDREFAYWFALADHGNLTWLDKELKTIDDATIKPTTEGEAFRDDLIEQREMAHDTLGGVFPLLRFFFKKILLAPDELYPNEILDDINVIAATGAVTEQIKTIVENWKAVPHFDVIFTSSPVNVAIENEALYLFNEHPKFFVHNLREKVVFIKQMASEDNVINLDALNSEILEKAKTHFDASHVILIDLQQQNSPEGTSFFISEASVVELNTLKLNRIRNMGFAVDNSKQLANFFFISIVSIIFGYFHLRMQGVFQRNKDVLLDCLVYAGVFLFALVAPSIVGPIAKTVIFVPTLETLAVAGWWIVPIASLVTICVPSLVMFGGVERMRGAFALGQSNYGDAALLAVIQAGHMWLLLLYAIYKDSEASSLFMAGLAALPFVLFQFWKGYLVGLKIKPTILFLLTYCSLTIAVMTASTVIFWITVGMLTLLHVGIFIQFQNAISIGRNTPNPNKLQQIKQNSKSLVADQILKKIRNSEKPSIFLFTSDDTHFGEHIFDLLNYELAVTENSHDIDATSCRTSYALVSKIVNQEINSNDNSFDAALGVASDFIPFGALISERATTSDVKDSHIKECGFTHFRDLLEKNDISHLFIRNFSTEDAASASWLEELLERPFAQRLTVYLLLPDKNDVTFFRSQPIRRIHLEHMDEIEATSFLEQCGLADTSLARQIIDELANESNYFMAEDLLFFAEEAEKLVSSSPSLAPKIVVENILETARENTDETVLREIDSLCAEADLKRLLAVSSYLGQEVDLKLLADILETDIKNVFGLIDRVNEKLRVFIDPRGAKLCIVFRSSKLHKACHRYFEFNQSDNAQPSYSQVASSLSRKELLSRVSVSDQQRVDILRYLVDAKSIDKNWVANEIITTSRRFCLEKSLDLAEELRILAKKMSSSKEFSIDKETREFLDRELECNDLIAILLLSNSRPEKAQKIENFYHRWGGWISVDADLNYLVLKSLYDSRSRNGSEIELLKSKM